MTLHFVDWRPQTITRVIRTDIGSSTRVAVVETDAGDGYLKAMGNPEGEHALARELLGTLLAKRLLLPVFDFAVIDVTDLDEIALGNRLARPGPAFITRAERGAPLGGGNDAYILSRLDNPHDIARLVVFDTWILNCDRHDCPDRVGAWKPRRDNVFASREGATEENFILKSMDHTHCLLAKPLTPRIADIEIRQQSGVFGLFPEFKDRIREADVQRACEDLRSITRRELEDTVCCLPQEWQVEAKAREALLELLRFRVSFVADSIREWIWPQMKLPFDDR
jgi:hypothetical protein